MASSSRTPDDVAAEIAEELFATADEVDALPILPRARLDRLAEVGFYGAAATPELGGPGWSFPDVLPAMATLAGGCLATTLVWLQHNGPMSAVTHGPAHLRERYGRKLATGELRGSVAFAGLLPVPRLRGAPLPDGRWRLDGTAPWVSGWGLTDVVNVSVRTPEDDVVWLLLDAVESPTLRATPLQLLAVNASSTVTLTFDGHVVDSERELGRFPWAEWPARDAAGLRVNGSLALGVAGRCCALLGASSLDDDLAAVRDRLDTAATEDMPAARAAAAALAHRAATALVVDRGSGSVVSGATAGRLLREATLLLVFATRPAIRRELLATYRPDR